MLVIRSPQYESLAQDMNPMVEPTFDQENSPWNARGGRGDEASRWPMMSATSPVRVQHQVTHHAHAPLWPCICRFEGGGGAPPPPPPAPPPPPNTAHYTHTHMEHGLPLRLY